MSVIARSPVINLAALAAVIVAAPLMGQPAQSDWVSLGFARPAHRIAFDPFFPSTIYAASSGALFRTVDGGESWAEADAGMLPAEGSVTRLVTTDSAIFVEKPGGVFRSIDGGRSWTLHSAGTPPHRVLGVTARPGGTYFLNRKSCSDIECLLHCLSTVCVRIDVGDDSGIVRSSIPVPSYGIALASRPIVLAASPQAPDRVFAGADDWVWNSSTGDERVSGIVTDLTPASREVVYAIVSKSGGTTVLRRGPGGWAGAGSGLPQAVYALAAHPSLPEMVHAGTSDGVYRSTDGGRTWSEYGLSGQRVVSLAIDPKDPSSLYAGTGEGLFVRKAGSATPSACVESPGIPCLDGGRFRIEVAWRTEDGRQGRALASHVTPDTASFWFFHPDNIEVVVKVLDGTWVNGRHWVFAGSLSTIHFEITVTDTRTGDQRHYVNPPGRLASVGDAEAFADTPEPTPAAGVALDLAPMASTAYLGPTPACSRDARNLCLNARRFRASIAWATGDGRSGAGEAVPLTGDTGYFWFFDDANVELVLKVLDGRGINGHFWVFSGALSNVAYTITVTDTETGVVKTYTNPQGQLASFADTGAF